MPERDHVVKMCIPIWTKQGIDRGHIRSLWDVGRGKGVVLQWTLLYHTMCFNKHALSFVIQITAVEKRKTGFSKR